jgi:hypothetical protein
MHQRQVCMGASYRSLRDQEYDNYGEIGEENYKTKTIIMQKQQTTTTTTKIIFSTAKQILVPQ